MKVLFFLFLWAAGVYASCSGDTDIEASLILVTATNKWTEYADCLGQYLSVHPGVSDVWKRLAATQERLGDLPSAAQSLATAARLAPGNGEFETLRSRILLSLGQQSEAEATARVGALLRPADPVAHFVLGMVRLSSGDAYAAAEHMLRAFWLDLARATGEEAARLGTGEAQGDAHERRQEHGNGYGNGYGYGYGHGHGHGQNQGQGHAGEGATVANLVAAHEAAHESGPLWSLRGGAARLDRALLLADVLVAAGDPERAFEVLASAGKLSPVTGKAVAARVLAAMGRALLAPTRAGLGGSRRGRDAKRAEATGPLLALARLREPGALETAQPLLAWASLAAGANARAMELGWQIIHRDYRDLTGLVLVNLASRRLYDWSERNPKIFGLAAVLRPTLTSLLSVPVSAAASAEVAVTARAVVGLEEMYPQLPFDADLLALLARARARVEMLRMHAEGVRPFAHLPARRDRAWFGGKLRVGVLACDLDAPRSKLFSLLPRSLDLYAYDVCAGARAGAGAGAGAGSSSGDRAARGARGARAAITARAAAVRLFLTGVSPAGQSSPVPGTSAGADADANSAKNTGADGFAYAYADADAVARAIRGDGVDVLVSTLRPSDPGWLAVLLRRPSPVQMVYSDSPWSTGAREAADYLLADRDTAPPELAAKLIAEKIIYLPSPFMPWVRTSERGVVSDAGADARQGDAAEAGGAPKKQRSGTVTASSRPLLLAPATASGNSLAKTGAEVGDPSSSFASSSSHPHASSSSSVLLGRPGNPSAGDKGTTMPAPSDTRAPVMLAGAAFARSGALSAGSGAAGQHHGRGGANPEVCLTAAPSAAKLENPVQAAVGKRVKLVERQVRVVLAPARKVRVDGQGDSEQKKAPGPFSISNTEADEQRERELKGEEMSSEEMRTEEMKSEEMSSEEISSKEKRSGERGPRSVDAAPGPSLALVWASPVTQLEPLAVDALAAGLRLVEDAVAVFGLLPFADQAIAARIKRDFAARGVDASRLRFVADPLAWASDAGANGSAGAVLMDPPRVSDPVLVARAVAAGVPIVTTPGMTMQSRGGAALLRHLGCPELVAANLADAVSLSVSLARGTPGRADALHCLITKGKEGVADFDYGRLADQIAIALENAWEAYLSPERRELAHFSV